METQGGNETCSRSYNKVVDDTNEPPEFLTLGAVSLHHLVLLALLHRLSVM